jgi:branched-chain amino acid transport system ATP-binding protein
MLLRGEGITKCFGGLVALNNVSFSIESGEIVGLIGPNGSGKTTLFNVISGFYVPEQGRVFFTGQDITGRKPYEIARLGIGRTFQIPQSFPSLTTLENVAIGVLYSQRLRRFSEASVQAQRLLQLVGLACKQLTLVKDLTLSEKKRLEIARALSTNPKVLLLDEVFAGLNPVETREAISLIQRLRDELGLTIFIVEHIMKAIMSTCDRIIVLNYGKKIAEGTPAEIAANREVQEVYLGKAWQ